MPDSRPGYFREMWLGNQGAKVSSWIGNTHTLFSSLNYVCSPADIENLNFGNEWQ
jgi:hypothetical protein